MTTIAITANTSWYLYNFRKNTICSLLEKKYVVITIAPKDKYSVELERLGARYIHIDIDQGGKNPYRDIKTLLSFCSIISKNKIDAVLNFTPKNNVYCTLAAAINKTKVINNVAGLGFLFVNESLSSKVARLLYKFSQRFADKVFFQNEDDRNLFVINEIVNHEITERLPGSGVDLSRFVVTPAPDDGTVRFLLSARMLYDKGVGHYVDAARMIKKEYGESVEFRLLGFLDVDNPSAVSKSDMQAWVDEGIVSYLGTSDKVEDEIAQVDCMVLPSFYREGVPKSLLEAGAMGKPIITTDNVGCRETVDHDMNGFLCHPQDTLSLYEAMKKVIEIGHEKRLSMGQLSREKMQTTFDEQFIINSYVDAVWQVLNQK
ncbi:glycosyltransferase family 4 protein [Salinivibrio kushneri]|uniref:glycosyltransferase family 4 protein n=1 Tax=Salinivibrio kushneri TaxID=1908198 RepID=UPI0022B45DC8|nr:glycosyltransferase family 4 protein [Salinivibrio kushneri]WBA17143.1 glycosyltransferase family 4 protein [Salinivibrio kushneri]